MFIESDSGYLVRRKSVELDDGAGGIVHLPQVLVRSSLVLSIAPMISTSLYHAGDCLGGKQMLTDVARTAGGVAWLQSLFVLDRANQKAILDVLFFDADPTAATLVDHSPVALSSDVAKVIGRVQVAAGDWVTFGAMAVAQLKALMLPLKSAATQNLWASISTPGTPTYGATDALRLVLGIDQD